VKLLTFASFLFLLLGCVDNGPGEDPVLGEAPEDELPVGDGDEGEEPLPPEPPVLLPPATFVSGVDHTYMPLAPGTVWSYAGHEDGLPKREEVAVLDGAHMVLGVPCTAVQEQIFLDGELVELTTHYLAQDSDGNVWRFGEQSIEYGDGPPVITDDSWEAGVDGAVPWLCLSADPQPGDAFIADGQDGGTDVFTVVSVDAVATVPAGVFQGCAEVEETNAEDVEDRDRILYAPGVGLVSEESPNGRIDLVSHGVR
jgi:hypothetical protein